MPDIEGGEYLVAILFAVGPTRTDAPLAEVDLEPWERRRGVKLHPWQAEAIIDMSRAYMSQAHKAKAMAAPPPWLRAVKMWKYVRDQLNTPPEKRNGRSQ